MVWTQNLPPLYDDQSQSSASLPRNKVDYVEIPVQCPSDSMTIPSYDDDQRDDLRDSLGLFSTGEHYCGLNQDIQDNNALYELIVSMISRSSPQFYLKVTGYPSKSQFESFSFTVPLPKLSPLQGSLFSKADDCPSIRDSKDVPSASGVMKRMRRRPYIWPDRYCKKDEAQVTKSTKMEVANISSLQQWNVRRRRNLIPPWVALSEESQGEVMLPSKGSPRQHLRMFLTPHPKRSASSRWLIVPQISYGWDLEYIKGKLNKMIPRVVFHASSLDRVEVDIVGQPPLLSVRYFKTQSMAKMYQSGIMQLIPYQIHITLSSVISSIFVAVGSILDIYTDMSRSSRLVFLFFAILGCLSTLTRCCLSTLIKEETIDDTVGVAWGLKEWIKIEIPSHFSKMEALDQMQTSALLCGSGQSVEESRVQQREDGWYLQVGMNESDWLARYAAEIEEGFKKGKNGNIGHHSFSLEPF